MIPISLLVTSITCIAVLTPLSCRAQQELPTERFGSILAFGNQEKPLFTMILFSDSSGIDEDSKAIGREGASQGGLVAVVDSSKYFSALDADVGDCSYLGGELIRLNQSVLSSLKVASYEPPILAGVRDGASLAYSIFAQKPDEFPGLLTVSFCPTVRLARPLCSSEYISFTTPKGHEQKIMKSEIGIPGAWYSFSAPEGFCGTVDTKSFEEMFKAGAQWHSPKFDATKEKEHLKEALQALNVSSDKMLATEATQDMNLPVQTLIPESISPPFQVIFLSGDGGWAWIDKGIANEFYQSGIPVVGLDSLRFFWTQRTPRETAHAIEVLLKKYRQTTKTDSFILVGFSFGAEVIPFAVQELSPSIRKNLKAIALLNPGLSSSFEIHITDWISSDDDDDGPYKLKDALGKLAGIPTFCIFGTDEDDSSCVNAKGPQLEAIGIPGDHHFDGEYAVVAKAILNGMQRLGLPSASPKQSP